ncbi:hypothetical protein DQ04_00531020 [Trypanosoma grayi]|uniref:hypothetical protein n=1 Tax=Trypanosoma grayi TaxID=71804 RepID=UPI0004F474BB|nr:hypothetical protein DQ04_00531020 [Trypanosoma grayi]KEG14297.1 hypothetical protein DQ04_00531020 [Trypanosoma grayi]
MWAWLRSTTIETAATTAKTGPVSGSSFQLEDQLHRVTASDIAHVLPSDVERVKQQMTPEDFQRAMRVLLEDNRYGEVIASAPPSALREAARGLTAVQLSSFTTIAKSNLLALYNVLPYATEAHVAEMSAVHNGNK